MPRPRLSPLATLSFTLVALAACGPGGQPGGHGEGGMPPAVVAVQEVKPRPVPVEFEYPAQTAGSREVEVRARVPGILLKRNYEEGARVAAGQSLFSIDAAQYEAAVARAEADVAAAEARLSQASRNVKRTRPLFEAKAASQKDLDDAVSAEEVAAADLKAARARLREAKLNLEYTRVEAPVAGVTSRALRSEGSFVSGPEVLLTTISQLDPMYVNFGIPQAEQARLAREAAEGKLAMPKDGRFDVVVRLEDGRTLERTGKLAFTDVRVNAQTGTSDARAEIPNANNALRPGQFVRVVLKGAVRPDAVTVPQRAVMEGPQGRMVYLLGPENKAVPRPIAVGDWVAGDWIVTSGLEGGEKVIVDGLMKVFPGATVQVGDPDAQPPGVGGPPRADGKAPADAKK